MNTKEKKKKTEIQEFHHQQQEGFRKKRTKHEDSQVDTQAHGGTEWPRLVASPWRCGWVLDNRAGNIINIKRQ
jgi:hypothetical protein